MHKSKATTSHLMNVKQLSDSPLSHSFCSNSSLSPPYNTIPMGEVGDY